MILQSGNDMISIGSDSMAHLIQSFEDLVKLLEQEPDLRPRLLRVLLTEDFLRLPEKVDRLEEGLTKLIHQVFLLAESHRELAESHRELTERHGQLAESVKELVESHNVLQMKMGTLADGQKLMMDLLQQTLNVVHSNSKSVESLVRSVETMGISQNEMRQELKELSEKLN